MPTTAQELDRLLRQKLAEVPAPAAPPAGWQRLTDALDQDVDHGLRATLTGLAEGQPANGWERLERKLDPQATSDAAIAAALSGLTPNPPAGGWEALKNQLDESLGAEVDTIVQHHLRKEASQTSGWAALAARLELISHRRQLVGAWKVVEVSLLASLMLLLLRFGPGAKEGNDVIAALHEGFPISADQSAERPGAATPQGRESTQGVLPLSEREAMLASDRHQTLNHRPNTPVTAPQQPAQATSLNAARAAAVATLPGPVYRVETGQYDLPSAQKTDWLTGPEYTAEWSTTLPSPALDLPAINTAIPVRYHLNIFASPTEINEVITPNSAVGVLDIKGRSEFTHSVSAGALLDVSKGNDGLQIGIIYGRHAYTPAELSLRDCFVIGDCPDGFNRFEYHSISFPFSYERSLLNRNDWRIATRVGMSMSVITQFDFEEPANAETTIEQALRSTQSSSRSPRQEPIENTIQEHKVLDPEQGWFEGGSLLNNASFYLGGGFTVERSITPRFSFYLSPSYGRVIYLNEGEGVGPYNDRIHRASLRFGSRFLLSRR